MSGGTPRWDGGGPNRAAAAVRGGRGGGAQGSSSLGLPPPPRLAPASPLLAARLPRPLRSAQPLLLFPLACLGRLKDHFGLPDDPHRMFGVSEHEAQVGKGAGGPAAAGGVPPAAGPAQRWGPVAPPDIYPCGRVGGGEALVEGCSSSGEQLGQAGARAPTSATALTLAHAPSAHTPKLPLLPLPTNRSALAMLAAQKH